MGTLRPVEIRSMRWEGGVLLLLDQRRLPQREDWLRLSTWQEVAESIRDMAVRGAPAIGVAAAYGMALAAKSGADLEEARKGLLSTRPTAVNLQWALNRAMRLPEHTFEAVLAEAERIEQEDVECNRAIGRHGASLLSSGSTVMTLCNTGSLATAGFGTALGIIREAHAKGRIGLVYACETRPRQQGLRLTAWELLQDGIPFKAIADGAAGALMAKGVIDAVITGADRIAANGDTANKLGTYALAVLARHHGVPFIVAAPSSTLDHSLPDGSLIPIEERSPNELTHVEGIRVAPEPCPVFNPAFDVTPGELIDAIVTESGIHRKPYRFCD